MRTVSQVCAEQSGPVSSQADELENEDSGLSREQYSLLVDAGLGLLSSLDRMDHLLATAVDYALKIMRAEAASLYVVKDNVLEFRVARNLVLEASGEAGLLPECRIELTDDSVAGYVARRGEIVFVDDVYNLPSDLPFRFAGTINEETGFRSRSMFVLPLLGNENRTVGVLQLINHRGDKGIMPFPRSLEVAGKALAVEIGVSLHNALLQNRLRTAEEETVYRLCLAAETRDNETASHLRRTSRYIRILVGRMRVNREWARSVEAAAPLHDIGKIGIPDHILNKQGELTEEEWTTMRNHTKIGHRILVGSKSELLQFGAEIALTHHEKWNGKGYPQGLKGDEIPVEGRLMALVDVFDALTTKRPYKEPWSLDRAFEYIEKESGHHFQPSLTGLFLDERETVTAVYNRFKEEGSPVLEGVTL